MVGALWLVKATAGQPFEDHCVVAALASALLFLLCGQVLGLYSRWKSPPPNVEILQVLSTWGATVLGLSVLNLATRSGELFARSHIFTWILLAPTLIALVRMVVRIMTRTAIQRGVGMRNVAIIGCNPLGLEVAKGLMREEDSHFRFVGFYDDRDVSRSLAAPDDLAKIRGSLADLCEQTRAREVDVVLIALPMRAEARIRSLLDQFSDTTASVYIVPDIFVFELLHSKWNNIGGFSAVSVFETPFYGVDGAMKRCLDLCVAAAALLVAGIPMLIIAALIKLTSRGPILFSQRRYGLDGEEIRVFKFRSMRTCDDGPVVKQATKNDSRITPLGSILRKTSLDELPQLFNVIEGTMSLVGPRPHASAHNEQYRRLIRGYMLRHKVKPGITGLAQVEGCRGETDTLDKMQRRVEYDHRYIRDWSIFLDLKILFKTLLVAWRQPEAY